MLAEHNFHPHRALRKGANTIYIKAADHIEDLLTFMGRGRRGHAYHGPAHVQ